MSTDATVIWRNSGTSMLLYEGRDGEAVDVICDINPSEYDVADVGTMFLVRFPDGFIGEAFDDELEGDFLID